MAQGIGGGDAERAPACEAHRGPRIGRTDEITDAHLDRGGGIEHGLGVERVGAAEQGDAVELDNGVDRACAIDGDRTASQRDRHVLRDARRDGTCERVEAEVVPGQRAEVDLQA